MASGRKNRGSRHRSHKHKQQKADDSAETDTDESLAHGPNPIPNPNPSPSWPLPMTPLPPYFEGPSVLNQENIAPNGNLNLQKGLHANRRKEILVSISDAAVMDQQKEANPSSLLESLDRKFIVPGDDLHSKGDGAVKVNKGKDKEGRARSSSQHADTICRNPIHVGSLININSELEADRYSNSSLPQSARACSNATEALSLKHKAFVSDKSSCQMMMEPEKKRARREDLLQMPKELGGALVQGNVRNPEREKEPESQIGRHKGDSRDGESSRDNRCLEGQNQREIWKAGRHTDRKHKEESQKVDNGQENFPKGWDINRKAKGSREDKVEGEVKDNRQKDIACKLKDDTCKEEAWKYVKQRDVREPEGFCKENMSRRGGYKDKKGNEVSFANLGDFSEQEMLRSDEYSSWHKGDKTSMKPRQLDTLEQRRENFKEGRKVKGRSSKEEKIYKFQKGKLEERNEEALAQAKSKYEKKKEDKDQDIFRKQKEEQDIDCAANAHDRYEKRRCERENNFKVRFDVKTHDGKGKFVKQSDGKDVDGLERHGQGRLGFEGRGKCIETVSKYEKIQGISNKDEKHRDDWSIGDGGLKERGRGEERTCSKNRDGTKERLWGGILQWKNGSSCKENTGAQKPARDKDDRQRNSSGLEKLRDKQRKEYGGTDEFADEVIKPDAADSSRLRNTGEKDGRHMNVMKGQSDRLLKHGKILDRQLKRKWNHEFAEPKERKGHVLNKADGTSLRASRATSSQNQMRPSSTTAALISSTARNQSNRSQNFDIAIADRDHIRPRSKLTEELVDLSNEDKPWQEKFGQRDKFEMNVVNQSSSSTRRSREQNWLMTDNAEEGKHYQEPRPSRQYSVDEKRCALPHERTLVHQPSLSPSLGDEELMRGSNPLLLNNATVNKRKHPNSTQGVGSSKTRRVDEGSMERIEPRHQGSRVNQMATDGHSAMRMPSNRPLGYSAIVPPLPYRSDVDNPAVMDPSSIRLEGSNSRENGRYNRKLSGAHLRRSEIAGPGDIWGGFGMGRWNYHNQVPDPGPIHMFPGFPQMGSRGLLGMGQQFHAPHMLGPYGTRLSADMGFRGARSHMGDAVAGFPVHDPNFGRWPRFPNGNEAHGPLSGLVDIWDRPGRYLDKFSSCGHAGWSLYSQAMPEGGWEGVCEAWQGQEEDVSITTTQSHRESVSQVSIEDAASDPELHVEKVEAEKDDEVLDTIGISPAHTLPKALSKASKFIKQRMQTMLLYANISAELAGIDLYRAYLNLLPPSETKQRKAGTEDYVVVPDGFIDEDLVYEVDAEAQDLLLDTNPLQLFLPSFSDSGYKNALRVFHQRPVQQDCVQKSVAGSFLLPQSSLMIKIPIYDLGSVRGAHIGSSEVQLGLQMGPKLETEVDHSGTMKTDKVKIQSSEEISGFEGTSLREMVEIQPNEKACVELEGKPVEDSSVFGNQDLGIPEHSVFGGENSSSSRHASIDHASREKNLANIGKSSVYELAMNLQSSVNVLVANFDNDQSFSMNELANLHVADHLEALQVMKTSVIEAQSHVDRARPINEVNYSSCDNDLEGPCVFDSEDSKGNFVEDKGEKLEVLSFANKEANKELKESFTGAEAFEITRLQECPKYVHGAWYHTNCTRHPQLDVAILQQCKRVTMLLSSFSSCGMAFRQFLDCQISYVFTFMVRRNAIRNGNICLHLLGHCDIVSFWPVFDLQLGFINFRRFLPWFVGSSSSTFILFLPPRKDGYKSIAYVKCDIIFLGRELLLPSVFGLKSVIIYSFVLKYFQVLGAISLGLSGTLGHKNMVLSYHQPYHGSLVRMSMDVLHCFHDAFSDMLS